MQILITKKVKWDPEFGISKQTHAEYLLQFGTRFYDSVKELIDRNARKPNFLVNLEKKDMQLMQEMMDHAKFCNESVEKFHGRNDLIEKVK